MHRLTFSLFLSTLLPLTAATTVFSDSEFTTPWAFTTPTNGTTTSPGIGGGGTAGYAEVATGGNPDRHADLRLDIGSNNRFVEAFYAAPGATHNPATQGAINTLTFQFDTRISATNSIGNAQAYGPGLMQNGIAYYVYHADSDLSWKTITDTGLTETSFFPYSGQGIAPTAPNYRPDFSQTGDLIQLGHYRGNSTVGVSAWVTGGLDNWQATVDFEAIPEPSSTLLISFGALILLRRRRA